MNRVTSLSLLSFSALFLHPVPARAVPSRAPDSLAAGSPLQTGQRYEDIRDIIGPVAINTDSQYLFYALAALCLAVAAVLLALFLFRRKKARPLPSADPADTALEKLARAESMLAETGTASFATEVSNILRHYIEQVFKLPSTTRTTSEFFTSVIKGTPHGLQEDIFSHTDSLEKCLSLCDLAKYAALLPARDATDHLLQEARTFINATRPEREAE